MSNQLVLSDFASGEALDLDKRDDWLEVGRRLGMFSNSVQWLIGDWIRHGERKWGEVYNDAMAVTGLDNGTLRNYAWVAGVFVSTRRQLLSWAHHREVATYVEDADGRMAWLKKAENGGWSVARLRSEIKQDDARRLIEDGAKKCQDAEPDLRQCSCEQLFREVSGIDAIITDPPYGKDALPAYKLLADGARSAVKEGGLVAVMCGQLWLSEVMATLCASLSYYWTMAYLTPGGGAPNIRTREVNTFWKPVLVFGVPARRFGDVVTSDSRDKKFHGWGQSEAGMAELVERLTNPGDLVCDPFLGAGTTGVVCKRLHRRFVGCDVDGAAIDIARLRIMAAGCVGGNQE